MEEAWNLDIVPKHSGHCPDKVQTDLADRHNCSFHVSYRVLIYFNILEACRCAVVIFVFLILD